MKTIPAYGPKATVSLCTDVYQDYLCEGGKLWPWVKEMAKQNDLFNRKARGLGIRVVYHVPY